MLGGRPRPADDGPPADQRQSAASGSRPRVSTLATLAGAVLRLQGLGEGLCLGVCSLVVNPYIHGIGRVLSGGKALCTGLFHNRVLLIKIAKIKFAEKSRNPKSPESNILGSSNRLKVLRSHRLPRHRMARKAAPEPAMKRARAALSAKTTVRGLS